MTHTSYNTFKGLPHDDEVVSRARTIFRSACEGADSYHALRLGLARRRALNALGKRSSVRVWAPLAAIATACCVVALGIAFLRPATTRVAAPPDASASAPAATGNHTNSDSDPLLDADSSHVEMVQNLDFYRWLASQPAVTPSAPKGGT